MMKGYVIAILVLTFSVVCGPSCQLVADEGKKYTVEDWLDLGSQTKLLCRYKKVPFPAQLRLIPLLHKSFIITMAVAVASDVDYKVTLYELPLKDTTKTDIYFKILSAIAKNIITHGTELGNCTLHPKEIYVSVAKGKLNAISSTQSVKRPENKALDISENPNEVFAYLMFYLLFPNTRELIDKDNGRITKKHFCCFNSEVRKFIPMNLCFL